MLRNITGALALCLLGTHSQAALLGRLPATPGGTDYQAVYDSTQNISWTANANLASTSGYCNTAGNCLNAAGPMTWMQAQAWIASLNIASYLGVNTWRLPNTAQPDATCSSQQVVSGFPNQSSGFNCTGSEMGNLFYNGLGGVGGSNIATTHNASYSLFSNVQASFYWSGTEYAPSTSNAWLFGFVNGNQGNPNKGNFHYAWAVRPGDIALSHVDADGDGIADDLDNCTLVANPTQLDADGDGYGNACDPDLNNDGVVNINDLNRLKARLGVTPVVDAAADLDGNGAVNINDLNRLKSFLGKPPGPSGLHPNCPPTCP
jgi:hypothetical protein